MTTKNANEMEAALLAKEHEDDVKRRTDMEAEATAQAATARSKLGDMPFACYPFMVTCADHVKIRKLVEYDATTQRSNKIITRRELFSTRPTIISRSRLEPGEIYTDVNNGKLRFWTCSIWDHPLVLYSQSWDVAKLIFQSREYSKEKGTKLVYAVDRDHLVHSPVGLVTFQSKLAWPLSQPNIITHALE